MTDGNLETIDPVDEFVNYWNNKSEEFKITPISAFKRHEYLKTFDDNMISFETSNGIVRPSRGFQKIPDHPMGFKFLSPEAITEKNCKSKYSAKEIFHKLDTVNTTVNLAINQGEEKYKEMQRKHEEEMQKNKKGFFDNAQLFLLNIFGKAK
jgi:hypothetical protein